MKWLALTIGGVSGTLARYFLAGYIYNRWGAQFPCGTLVVNLLGCFLIGFFATCAEEKFLFGPNARIFLMAGFCGAFTTFSTFILETGNLVKDSELNRAFLNVLFSVALGFLMYRFGMFLARWI